MGKSASRPVTSQLSEKQEQTDNVIASTNTLPDQQTDESKSIEWYPEYPILTKTLYFNGKLQHEPQESGMNMKNLTTPRRFFRVVKVLHRSFNNVIFRVCMKQSNEPFVLKMLTKSPSPAARKSILVELTALKLNSERACPFMVFFHSSFQTPIHCFLLMEYVPNGSLEERLRFINIFSESIATFYMAEICIAMFFLHNNGVLVRDIRPSNILVTRNGHLRMCDFSVSKTDMKGQMLTDTSTGTYRFMPPEMHNQVPYGKAVDYWAIGIILYRMVMGQMPFSGKTRVEYFQSVTGEREYYNETLHPNTISLCKAGRLHDSLLSGDWKRCMWMLDSSQKSVESSTSVNNPPFFLYVSCSQLLTKNQRQRLGYSQDAEENTRKHPFFDILSWKLVQDQSYFAPLVPRNADDGQIIWSGFVTRNDIMRQQVLKILCEKPNQLTTSISAFNMHDCVHSERKLVKSMSNYELLHKRTEGVRSAIHPALKLPDAFLKLNDDSDFRMSDRRHKSRPLLSESFSIEHLPTALPVISFEFVDDLAVAPRKSSLMTNPLPSKVKPKTSKTSVPEENIRQSVGGVPSRLKKVSETLEVPNIMPNLQKQINNGSRAPSSSDASRPLEDLGTPWVLQSQTDSKPESCSCWTRVKDCLSAQAFTCRALCCGVESLKENPPTADDKTRETKIPYKIDIFRDITETCKDILPEQLHGLLEKKKSVTTPKVFIPKLTRSISCHHVELAREIEILNSSSETRSHRRHSVKAMKAKESQHTKRHSLNITPPHEDTQEPSEGNA